MRSILSAEALIISCSHELSRITQLTDSGCHWSSGPRAGLSVRTEGNPLIAAQVDDVEWQPDCELVQLGDNQTSLRPRRLPTLLPAASAPAGPRLVADTTFTSMPCSRYPQSTPQPYHRLHCHTPSTTHLCHLNLVHGSKRNLMFCHVFQHLDDTFFF